jgi:predicted dehydrogenase
LTVGQDKNLADQLYVKHRSGASVKKQTGVVVGCGAIAREHLAVLAEFDHVDVAAVCDISLVRAEATAERYGIPRWYRTHSELLSDIRPDLVHITTPPASHAAIAKDFLVEGVNVLCEKPITVDYSDFSILKELALKNKIMLMEDQTYRYHSSIQRIRELMESGAFGDVLEVQICLSLNVCADGSPYLDRNSPHFALALPGGVIGDFLPHFAYLAYMFTGPILDVRTIWAKRLGETPLPADEFRALIRGKRASAYLSFNGSGEVDGFLLRVVGARMRVETDLFEPPRFTVRRLRRGEPALMKLVDGLGESRDVMKGSVRGFVRKLAGRSSYDGLEELLRSTYRTLELREPQPIPLAEIDETARLVQRLTQSEFKL